MSNLSDELVPIYFRRRDLAAAYRLALELEEGEDIAHGRAAPAAVEESVIPGWTVEQIERAYRESHAGMKLIFDGMIERPDEVLDSSDLASFLTHKPNATTEVVRGTMGAFANRCVSRYGRKHEDFPFRHWYVEGGYARYQMPAAVADVLRRLRAETP